MPLINRGGKKSVASGFFFQKLISVMLSLSPGDKYSRDPILQPKLLGMNLSQAEAFCHQYNVYCHQYNVINVLTKLELNFR